MVLVLTVTAVVVVVVVVTLVLVRRNGIRPSGLSEQQRLHRREGDALEADYQARLRDDEATGR